jgi:hypothetical protein
MRSILIRSRVGADGILHLDVPSDLVETEVEVIVIVQPTTQSPAHRREDLVWSSDFFEGVVGKWQGEPLTREWEGHCETRERM